MEALNEIAATGAPAIMTALGMGTVCLCLALLYAITRIIGSGLPRLVALLEGARPVENVAVATDGAAEVPATRHESANRQQELVAAMTLVLARHRSSRIRPVVDESKGVNPWKIAGRMRMLRDR
jgi:Na+-transporting methylmalonyl-CoA/oxaloacetate decarboxylase gamma subunit